MMRKKLRPSFGEKLTGDTLVSKNALSKGLDPEKIAQRLDEMARSMAYAIVFWDEGSEWLEFAPDAKRDVKAARRLSESWPVLKRRLKKL